MRKAVIFFKDDSFEGIVLTCYRINEPQGQSPMLLS
jgi:hypothetical protein